jgi:hypothetical protein
VPRQLLALLTTAALLCGCSAQGDDPARPVPESAPESASAPPCLITAEQVAEITGVEQSLSEVDAPPLDPGDDAVEEVSCDTALDEREVKISWQVGGADLTAGGPITHDELRIFVEQGDAKVTEAEVGAAEPAWVGTRSELSLVWATAAAVAEDSRLVVEVVGDDETTDVGQARTEVLAVTEALVEAVGDRR